MAETGAHVAHHFDDAEQQYEADQFGMWLFLATEVMFFGGLFLGYFIYRLAYPEAWHAGSHHLDRPLGTLNTGVLLLSSFTMALAVQAAQIDQRKRAVRLLLATLVLGSVFLVVKGIEYSHKFEENLVPGRSFVLAADGEVAEAEVQLFFSFYFAMTGLHAIHMIIGIVIVGIIAYNAHRGRYSSNFFTPVEVTGLYWHFVDIVWVFLYPLFYLAGGWPR
jgi:cytochrome c oxidase subunit 3